MICFEFIKDQALKFNDEVRIFQSIDFVEKLNKLSDTRFFNFI